MATIREYYNSGSDGTWTIYSDYWGFQTFTAGSTYVITSVKLYLNRFGMSPGTLTVSIRATSGGSPTGSDLTSGTTNANTLPTWPSSPEWRGITLTEYTLTSGIVYAIVFRCLTGNSYNHVNAWVDSSSPTYSGGTGGYSNDGGSTWSPQSGWDFMFENWGLSIYPSNKDESAKVSVLHSNSKDFSGQFNLPYSDSKDQHGKFKIQGSEYINYSARFLPELSSSMDLSGTFVPFLRHKLDILFDDAKYLLLGIETLKSEDIDSWDISGDLSSLTNSVTVIGGSEGIKDTFDGDTLSSEWTILSGTWTSSNNSVLASGTSPQVLTGSTRWGNITYYVSLYHESGTFDVRVLFRKLSNSFGWTDCYYVKMEGNGTDTVSLMYGTSVIGSYVFTPSTKTWYDLRIEANRSSITVFLDNNKIIEVNDTTSKEGYIGLGVPNGTTAYYRNLICSTDIPCLGGANDTELQNTYGIKAQTISVPEIINKNNAIRRATLELGKAKIVKTSGTLTLSGRQGIEPGDIFKLYIPEAGIYNTEYQVLETKLNLDNDWNTTLTVSQYLPELEAIQRLLESQTAAIASMGIDITDLISSTTVEIDITEAGIATLKDKGASVIGTAMVGLSDVG